jgi:hypothetical protein
MVAMFVGALHFEISRTLPRHGPLQLLGSTEPMPSEIKKCIFFDSELVFWSHTGLNLAYGIIATSGHTALCAQVGDETATKFSNGFGPRGHICFSTVTNIRVHLLPMNRVEDEHLEAYLEGAHAPWYAEPVI